MPNKTQVVFDAWDTYVRETEEAPLFISFDLEAASEDLTGTLPHCARVALPIRNPGPSGGPDRAENERLWQLEDDLCNVLSAQGVSCRLVGRLTYRGTRVLVFQLDDPATFRPVLAQWIASSGEEQAQLAEDEGWEFFNDCIRPSPEDWLFIADSKVIRQLIEAGTDPSKEHALEFVLQGEPGPLGEMAAALEAEGYERFDRFDPDSGEIVMVKKMPLELRAVTGESQRVYHMAEEIGVQYDGWGTAVVH